MAELCPPTTHFIATVDDVSNMLDFNLDDTDGMDVGTGDDSESTGHWLPPRHTIYTWWISLRRWTTTIRKIKPPGKSQNDGADIAPSPTTVKIAIKAPERSTPQSTPKATITLGTR